MSKRSPHCGSASSRHATPSAADPALVRKPQAYQTYLRNRRKQQRAIILTLGALLFAGLMAFAVWGVIRSAQSLLEALQPHSKRTTEFRRLLAQNPGFPETSSLLYDDARVFALFTAPVHGDLKRKLRPVLPIREDARLKAELQRLLARYPQALQPHLYYYNLQDGAFVDINGYQAVSAASVIKLPILLTYLLRLDRAAIRRDTPIPYALFHRAGGAGELQYRPTGDVFPVHEIARQMIRISDNTCTNMMIDILGGRDRVNEQFSSLGLSRTRIRNRLPDLEGTNTLSPYEMVTVLYNLDHLLSPVTRDEGLAILKNVRNRRLLVSPLPPGTPVAHKTGDIGAVLGDSGMIHLPNGERYILSVQVERPYNHAAAADMIREVSSTVYDHASCPDATP